MGRVKCKGCGLEERILSYCDFLEDSKHLHTRNQMPIAHRNLCFQELSGIPDQVWALPSYELCVASARSLYHVECDSGRLFKSQNIEIT